MIIVILAIPTILWETWHRLLTRTTTVQINLGNTLDTTRTQSINNRGVGKSIYCVVEKVWVVVVVHILLLESIQKQLQVDFAPVIY